MNQWRGLNGGGVGPGMKREVGQLVGKYERDWHLGGRVNGMATGDGGSRQRTEEARKVGDPRVA